MNQAVNTENPDTAQVQAAQLGDATSAEFSFAFRTDKVRDDEGKVIGTGRKHPSIKAVLPIPTYGDLITELQGRGKAAAAILDAVISMIDGAARAQINDFREGQGLEANFSANLFDLNKLTLAAISEVDKKDRAGAAISDEDWTAFLDDYAHTMVHTVGYEDKKVKLHVMHYKVLLRRIKNDKPAVKKLLDMLNVWASKTEAMEDHIACFEDLAKRANKYLAAKDVDTANSL